MSLHRLLLCQQLALSTLQSVQGLPPLDRHHRRKTFGYGYASAEMSPKQVEFVKNAKKSVDSGNDDARTPVVIDLGAGFGDFALYAAKQGLKVLAIEQNSQQSDIIKARFEKENLSHLLLSLSVKMPYPEQPSWGIPGPAQNRVISLLKTHRVVGIIATSSLMYLDGKETLQVLRWAYRILPPGGQFVIVGVTPHCNLFPAYEQRQQELLQAFREDPSKTPFPALIEDVYASPFTKPNEASDYDNSYPRKIHLIFPEVYAFHSKNVGFEVVESRYERRNYPEWMVYQGSEKDVGEIAVITLEKP